jgi:hypothetical protein
MNGGHADGDGTNGRSGRRGRPWRARAFVAAMEDAFGTAPRS